MDLRVTTRSVAGHRVLTLDGAADLAALPILHDALVRATTERPRAPIAVELDGLTVLDDAALGLLLGASARAAADGNGLVVVCGTGPIRQRLAATRLDEIVDVVDTIAPPVISDDGAVS